MRVLSGTKVIEAPPGIAETLRADPRPKVIDLGAGDGRYVYECARSNKHEIFIAVDPDATTLSDYAYRASRKPARGGVDNAHFVVASVEDLPAELWGIADRVRVNYPWGSLMRGLLEPDTEIVKAILALAKAGAPVEVVISYDPSHDKGAFAGLPLPALDDAYVESTLVPEYEAAGVQVTEHRRMTQDEALAIPSTWGRRLLHARPRDVFWIAMQGPAPQ